MDEAENCRWIGVAVGVDLNGVSVRSKAVIQFSERSAFDSSPTP
jgi:hypothetical protein